MSQDDVRELRGELGKLREVVAGHTQQLSNGEQFRRDLDALKAIGADRRIFLIEGDMSALQESHTELDHAVRNITGHFDGMAKEIATERAERKAADEASKQVEKTAIGWLKVNWVVVVVALLVVLTIIDALQDDLDTMDVVEQLEQRGVKLAPTP